MIEDKINIVLVEDHDMSASGIKFVLNEAGFTNTLKTFDTADSAYAHILSNEVDIVLLDLKLKSEDSNAQLLDGDDLLRSIRLQDIPIKVIVISMTDNLDILDYIIDNLGANGYILKGRNSLTEIIPAIECTLQGGVYLSPEIKIKRRDNVGLLELDHINRHILKALSKGLKQKNMLEYLKEREIILSLSAIEKRIHNLKDRLDIKTTTELVAIAVKEGLI